MKRIYSVLVENRSGVLCKVAGLFWRRCFNIDSLAVGETEDKNVSNMVIVSSGDRRTLEQIEKQLNKKLDVIKVKTFDETESINRELMLVKVRYNRSNRKDIMENCEIMDAKIVDMSKTMMTIQMCDTPERVQKDRNSGASQVRRAGQIRRYHAKISQIGAGMMPDRGYLGLT